MPEANTKRTKEDIDKGLEVDITGKTLREMNDAEALEYIKINSASAFTDKADGFERNRRYNDIYECLDPKELRIKESDGDIQEDERLYASSYLPVVAAQVDTAAANAYNALMSHPDYITADPLDRKDTLAVLTKILPHMKDTHRQINLRHKIFRAVLGAACFDYAITYSYWDLQAGFTPKREAFITDIDFGNGVKMPRRDINMKMEWRPDKIDRFNVGVIEYANCAHDPNSKDGFDDSEYFFDYRWEQFGKLRGMEYTESQPHGTYKNLDKLEEEMRVKAASKGGLPVSNNPTDEDNVKNLNYLRRERVRVLRVWTRYHVIESVGNTIIQRRDTYDWGLQKWEWSVRNGKFNGIGVAQRLERPQIDINADLSARRDYYNITLNPPMVVDGNMFNTEDGKIRITSGDILLKPTGSQYANIPAKDMLYVPQIGGNAPMATMAETNMSIDMIQRMSGVSDNTMAQFASGRRTAYEAGQVASGGAVRFGVIVERLEDTALEVIFNDHFLFNQLYMTNDVRYRDLGQEGFVSQMVTSVDYKLTGGCKFRARGSSKIQEDTIYKAQFMSGMNLAIQAPQFHKMPALFSKMWQILTPEDYNKFVIDPAAGRENIPQELEIQMMLGGNTVDVSPANDHAQHIGVIQAYKQTGDYTLWHPGQKQLLEQHLAGHQAGLQQGAAQAGGARTNSQGAAAGQTGVPGISQGQRAESGAITP